MAEPQGGLTEVSHDGLYQLRKFGNTFSIEHVVTGERAPLPLGCAWSLCYSEGRAFVSSQEGVSLWCADLLVTSLWAQGSGKRVKVYGKGLLDNGLDLNMWMDDLVEQRHIVRVDLPVPVGCGNFVHLAMKVYYLVLPRSGARVFWEVKRVAEFVASHAADKASWFRQGLRRSWAPAIVSHFGIPESHFVTGSSGVKSDVDLTGLFATQASLSTAALLALCAWWTVHAKKDSMVKGSVAVIEGFVSLLPNRFCVGVELPQVVLGHGEAVHIYEVMVHDRHLQPCAELVPMTGDVGMGVWPRTAFRLSLVAIFMPKGLERVLGALFRGLAARIDEVAAGLRPAATADLVAICTSRGNAIDPDMRAAVANTGRNAYKVSAFAKSFKAGVGVHYSKVDHMERQRYWLASRRCMSTATTHAISTDATRFSKKDWNCGTICNVAEGRYAWLQPMVGQFGAHLLSPGPKLSGAISRLLRSRFSNL